MAKQYRFVYKGHGLGSVNGTAQACKLNTDGTRASRVSLHTPSSPDAGARNALIAYVDRLEMLATDNDPPLAAVLDWYKKKIEDEGKVLASPLYAGSPLYTTFGTVRTSAVNDTMCKAAAVDWEQQGYARSTIHGLLNTLRSAIRWAEPNRGVPVGTSKRIWNIKTPPPRDRVLSPGELRALVDGCTLPHMRLYVLLLIYSAQRTNAVTTLRWEQVDMAAGTIDFRVDNEPQSILHKRGMKGRAVVTIPDDLRPALAEAKLAARTPFVVEYRGKKTDSIWRGFNAVRTRAGLGDDVTPHIVRHTAATLAYENGASVEDISRMLGHTNPNTTRGVYIHATADAAKTAQDAVAGKIDNVVQLKRKTG